MDTNPRYIRCYDNGGRTCDRYTVVFTGRYKRRTGGQFVYLAMNEQPYHPQGFGQHGFSDELIDRPKYAHLGKRIRFEELPTDCQTLVRDRYNALWNIKGE